MRIRSVQGLGELPEGWAIWEIMGKRWLGGEEKAGAAGVGGESLHRYDTRSLSFLSFFSTQMTETVTGSDLGTQQGNCCVCFYFHPTPPHPALHCTPKAATQAAELRLLRQLQTYTMS